LTLSERDSAGGIARGSARFWRANIALFLSAFAIFASLYSVQPLLPIFAGEFGLDAAASSFSLSVTTATLAGALLLASWVADRLGRKTLMVGALLVTAALGMILPFVPNWPWLLAVRSGLGLSLSGLPAIAMVYLAEEMESDALGFSMGLYIGGTALGGMAGRLLVGIVADWTGWRFALELLGMTILVIALLFVWLLPTPQNSARTPLSGREFVFRLRLQFNDPGLPWLFATSFLLMGAFVTLYNYTGFRLSGAPYGMSHSAISLIFLVYAWGTVSSTYAGELSNRFGRRRVLLVTVAVMLGGLLLTLLPWVVAIIGGLAVVSVGFFAAHGIASAWVTRRAPVGRAQASALYLFFYYVGSSVLGTLGGYAWVAFGWPGVAGLTGMALVAALLVALRLSVLPPLPVAEKPVTPPAGV